ncbi:MAG: hypothetical protein GMKNLPBB_01674 [Myxococcota bacterium]|nr:hypothetical protein [Myxococcota bacterium]
MCGVPDSRYARNEVFMSRKILFAFVLLGLMVSSPAWAQKKGEAKGRASTIIELQDTEIKGEVQRAEVGYNLARSTYRHEDIERPESFLDKIEESVQKEPF